MLSHTDVLNGIGGVGGLRKAHEAYETLVSKRSVCEERLAEKSGEAILL